MTTSRAETPRRRVLRSSAAVNAAELRQQQARERDLAKLGKEQAVFRRWMSRLKRAFHALEKSQRRIARLEKRIAGHQ